MKKENKYIIDEEDYELLMSPISENPCLSCSVDWLICCGCSDGRKYEEEQQKFAKNNLSEARYYFVQAKKAQKSILKQQKIFEDSRNALEKMGFDLDKLF